MRSVLPTLSYFRARRQIGRRSTADGTADRVEISMTTSGFTAVIKIRDINPFILVSSSRANAVKPGWRKPLPVLLRINGKPANGWRTNMMPVGNGSFYLYLHGDIRKASGTAVGDRVRVEIAFDASYKNGPQHPMPRWFKQALAGNPQATKNWTALIPAAKRRYSATSRASIHRTPMQGTSPKPSACFRAKRADSWRARGRTDHRRSVRLVAAVTSERSLRSTRRHVVLSGARECRGGAGGFACRKLSTSKNWQA